jgi:hypothetical protein
MLRDKSIGRIEVRIVSENDKEQCRHRYIVGYSFRMPQLFFYSLLCDSCNHRIKLSSPWLVIFRLTSSIGWIFAFCVSTSVHIKLLGSTFFIQLFVFLLLIWMVQLIKRLILKYGKWIEMDKK